MPHATSRGQCRANALDLARQLRHLARKIEDDLNGRTPARPDTMRAKELADRLDGEIRDMDTIDATVARMEARETRTRKAA